MTIDSEQRAFIYDLWEKIQNDSPMSPLEKQISKVIEMHPESHPMLDSRNKYETHEFKINEVDPFAHIGLHSIIVEMISSDSPAGIRPLYDRWVSIVGDKHEVQHEFMVMYFDELIASMDQDRDFDSEALLRAMTEELDMRGDGQDGG